MSTPLQVSLPKEEQTFIDKIVAESHGRPKIHRCNVSLTN